MAEVTGNVINLTDDEKQKQDETVSNLLKEINNSNNTFVETKAKEEEALKQKEADENFKKENEIYATKSKNFAIASEEDHQKLLERIKESEEKEKAERKNNFFSDAFHKMSVLSKQMKQKKREDNTVTQINIQDDNNLISNVQTEKVKEDAPDYYYMATHDTLTSLKNRRAFEEDKKTLILDQCSFISIDVNNLKYMNDMFGHNIGDLLLTTISNALKTYFLETNCYRFGGDEFLAICKNKKDTNIKINGFNKYLDKETKKYKKEKYVFSASIGVAEYLNNDEDTIEKILERADEKMYEAKKEYKKTHQMFDMRQNDNEVINEKSQQQQIDKEELKRQIREELLQEQEALKQAELEKQKEQTKTTDDLTADEYNEQLSDDLKETKEEALDNNVTSKVSLSRILNNIQQREMDSNNQLYYICIATMDMNSLIVLRNIRAFVDLINDAEIDFVQCSYIYAIFSSGAAWYGNNLPVKGIQKIFDALVDACIAKRGRPLSQDEFLKIPDINIFKDIYLQ